MVDYREILRLDKENYSQRQIEASTGISMLSKQPKQQDLSGRSLRSLRTKFCA